jgi:hypothetical protein
MPAMDYERTSAPYDSPPPPPASPLDWLLRLRLRAGGTATASVLVGAGISALVFAVATTVLGLTGLDIGDNGWLVPAPGRTALQAVFLSDVAGGFAIGLMARRHTLLRAGLTGLTLRLPRLFAALHAPLVLWPILSPNPAVTLGKLFLSGVGVVVLSISLWLLAGAVGEALAVRRLDGLGLR